MIPDRGLVPSFGHFAFQKALGGGSALFEEEIAQHQAHEVKSDARAESDGLGRPTVRNKLVTMGGKHSSNHG